MHSTLEQVTKFPCPRCGQRIGVSYGMIGKRLTCPTCHAAIEVPRPAGAMPIWGGPPTHTGDGTVTPPLLERKPCPYCEEPIRATARKCKHCGEFLDEEIRRERGRGGRLTASERVLRIALRERRVGSIWIGVGVLQCVTVLLALAGVWNIVRGNRLRKRADRIQERDATVPSELEPVTPIVWTVVVNLLLGAGIGVPVAVLDAIVRRKVLDDRSLFQRLAENSAFNGSLGVKTPPAVVLSAPFELAFALMRDTLVEAGGTLFMDDIQSGVIAATWSYGSNVFGLRVTSLVRRTSQNYVQVTVRGGFKDMPDTFGHARQKAMAIRDAYLEMFDDTDYVVQE